MTVPLYACDTIVISLTSSMYSLLTNVVFALKMKMSSFHGSCLAR
jgi:hypothetical protein